MALHLLVVALRRCQPAAAIVILIRLLLVLVLSVTAGASSTPDLADPPMTVPDCQTRCGNVSIPFPFGIGQGCFREGFEITCNETIGVPYLSNGNIDVVNIYMDGLLVVNQYKAYDCYNEDGSNNTYNNPSIAILRLKNYRFSDQRNKFFALGCDTMGYLNGTIGYSDGTLTNFETGCFSVCNSSRSVVNGNCSGIGCCEAPVPRGLRYFDVILDKFKYNHTNCWQFNPCSYGFVADADWLNFGLSNYTDLEDVDDIPVTLDWAIMDETCEEAKKNTSAYACVSDNSDCRDSPNGPGYLCICRNGFSGNPYLTGTGGCKDIDECSINKCVKSCKNTEGSYHCSCPWHMYGDGKIDGSGCKSILKLLYLILGGCLSLLFVVTIASWMYWTIRKKRLMELKEKFFRQNGGFLLQQRRTSLESSSNAATMTRLFSAEELEIATDNYKQSRVLGEGGAGTVYKGVLPDSTTVAIKKSKVTNNIEIEQFINEVVVLSRINHRNVVGLLGCCLETQVPLLVYEFIPNGTLFERIHGEGRMGSLSYEARLRIASEVAGALSYLHSAAAVPIIHRDVKSTNILLDDNLTAKVSDFGASRLVPIDQKGLVSLVRGTFGYLDPEYLHSGEFTDKSDVYSFGVVLVELITGRKPIDKSQSAEHKSLAALFTSYVKNGRLLEILEQRVVDEGPQQQLMAVAKLVERCLFLKGEERPSMKEVAMELEGLRRSNAHPWTKENEEEQELLLGGEEGHSSIVDLEGFADYDSSMTVTRFVPLDIVR